MHVLSTYILINILGFSRFKKESTIFRSNFCDNDICSLFCYLVLLIAIFLHFSRTPLHSPLIISSLHEPAFAAAHGDAEGEAVALQEVFVAEAAVAQAEG